MKKMIKRIIEKLNPIKKIREALYFILFIIYEELVFSCLIFGRFPASFLLIILLSIPIGLFLNIICRIFGKITNIILTYFIVCLVVLATCAQLIYYRMYETIISFASFTHGGQVAEFTNIILGYLAKNWYAILLFILPIVVLIVLHIFKKISFERVVLKKTLKTLICLCAVQIIALLAINFINPHNIYSNKNLYYNIFVPKITANKMGLFTTMRLDIQRYIFKIEENIYVEASARTYDETDKEKYNIKGIDFDKLIENETDKDIKSMHEFFKDENPTNKNKYTGMFEGKNLIVIVAESFSNIGIQKEVTPTLYKLQNEGFQFKNFYTPLFPVSTADGEYHTDNSLLPKEGEWSMYKVVRKPYAIFICKYI